MTLHVYRVNGRNEVAVHWPPVWGGGVGWKYAFISESKIKIAERVQHDRRCKKAVFLSGYKFHPATAPAGINRSCHETGEVAVVTCRVCKP